MRCNFRVRLVLLAIVPLMLEGFSMSAAAQTGTQTSVQSSAQPSTQETYAGYTVFRCMSAVVRTYRFLHRTIDTTKYRVSAPAIPLPLQRVAQGCIGAWKIDSIPPGELQALLSLSIYAADTVLEKAVTARMLALAKSPAARVDAFKKIGEANVLVNALYIYWPRLDWAITQLRANPGADAARARIYLEELVNAINGFGHIVDDTTMLRYLADAMTATNTLDNVEERKAAVNNLNVMRVQIALMNGDSIVNNGVALKMTPLNGTVVTGAGVYPRAGKINVVFMGEFGGYPPGAAIRRLQARYGDAVDFVFLQSTEGNFRLKAPLTFEQEAEARKAHMIDVLKLPGDFVLERTEITRLPAPDYRLIRHPTPNKIKYGQLNASIIIVDGDGRMRSLYPGWMGGYTEIRLERALDRILGKGK